MIPALSQGPPGLCAHSQSYSAVHADASGSPRKSWDFRAEILATIAVSGPLELSSLRGRSGLARALTTDLLESIRCLIRTGQIEAIPQTERVINTDGVRARRDFTLYALARRGGGEQ